MEMDLIISLLKVDLCSDLEPVMRIIGYVILGIKIAVPIILIIMGMIDLAKAVIGKVEDEIKKAQGALIKRAVAAVLVFLVFTLVTLVMTLVSAEDWKKCTKCLNTPQDCPDTSYSKLPQK